MADQKMYQAPGVDLHHLAQSLGQWYTGKGYKTQVMEGPGGAIVVQAAKGTSLITTATSQALTVTLTSQGDNLFVQTGGARWADKAVSGVVGLIVFWPLVALPAYGAYKQKEIIDETLRFIEQYLASGGQMPAPMMGAPMMGMGMAPAPAPAPAGGARCPSCGQSVRAGAKFCEKCGASLAAPACAKCGATLNPGAKFCASCGERV